MGGITKEDDNELVTGLPFLTKIPLIKNIVGSTSKAKNRRELLIFLQPHIIETTDDLVEKNIKEIRETIVGEDAIKAGSSQPEMDPALFPMGRKPLSGNEAKFLLSRYQEEASKPLTETNQNDQQKKKGIFSKLFRKKSKKGS